MYPGSRPRRPDGVQPLRTRQQSRSIVADIARLAGAGTALLDEARRRSPGGLELHTHQQNASARAFYEKHGFEAVRFGISPPPESSPDVEYHWRPPA